jgi:hypothetical protein
MMTKDLENVMYLDEDEAGTKENSPNSPDIAA